MGWIFDFDTTQELATAIITVIQNLCLTSTVFLMAYACWVFANKWVLPFVIAGQTEDDGVEDVEEARIEARRKTEKFRAIFRIAFGIAGFVIIIYFWVIIGGIIL